MGKEAMRQKDMQKQRALVAGATLLQLILACLFSVWHLWLACLCCRIGPLKAGTSHRWGGGALK